MNAQPSNSPDATAARSGSKQSAVYRTRNSKRLLPKPPEAARVLLARRKARYRLLDFTRYTFPEYRPNFHHRVLAEQLDRFVSGEVKRLMVFAPPQTGKSELVSRRLPAFLLGRNPDARIIATSYSDALASAMNRDVQRIVDGDRYRTLFPETRLSGANVRDIARGMYLRNTDLFEVVGREGRYRSAGVGGGITGMSADFVIVDDPFKNDEEAYSPTIRRKVLSWYDSVLHSRISVAGSILLTTTRWHRQDLAGTLLTRAADPAAEQWEVLSFEAVRGDDPRPYDPRRPGEALWPDRYPIDYMRQVQAGKGPVVWSAVYQQAPCAEGGAEWPDSFFGPQIWFDEWPRDLVIRGVGLDPSKGKGDKHGDYSAFVRVGVTPDGAVWVDADLRNDRNPSIIAETGVELCIRWKPDAFAVETNQFQELLVPEFQRLASQRGAVLPIFSVDNRVNKNLRIRRLTRWLSQGKMRFKADSPGARLLVQQLRDFPNGEHDDGPDALEMILRVLDQGPGEEMVAGRVG